MMASGKSIYLENLTEFVDLDIDMEVKSESDEEINCSDKIFDNDNEFDIEFIIPEKQKPDSVAPEESVRILETEGTCDLSLTDSEEVDSASWNSDDDDVEDEPEVEIDEVTVQQELVEVALEPSLLLYVKRDKKPLDQQQQHQQYQLNRIPTVVVPEQMGNPSNLAIQTPEAEKPLCDDHALSAPLLSDQEDVLFPVTNTKNRNNAVTAALRKVKRKPHREPLEPLNEIECSNNKIDNARNIDNITSRHEKQNNELHDDYVHKNRMNGNNDDDSDDNERELFCGSPLPCESDSETKEQKDITVKSSVVTKRRRGRPRLKPLDFQDRVSSKRKRKNKKVRKKAKVKHKSKSKTKELTKSKKGLLEGSQAMKQLSSAVEDIVIDVAKEMNGCGLINHWDGENTKDIGFDENPVKEHQKKERKPKKEKKKPSIFDEVKMEYTVLNEDQPKEKPKRIRKRDKKSRELAALSKPESFDCTECGRKFKEKSHLATHARAHNDVRNFKCNRCGNLFKTKTSLFFHMKTHSDAPFTCEKCNKTYPERRMLMRHIRVVHSLQNLFSCDQCGREFKSMNNLSLHYTLHTGVKPFTCNNCGKSFVYKSTYIAHMKGHDADNSFNCELCPKTYCNKAEFRRLCNHHSEARPWLCTVCGKGYPLKGTLKNHMKTHEPEKPFKCPQCPKSFMKKQSFECHLKIHAGESPQFMCDQCSQSYFNVFALKRHYLKHTSERRFSCEVCNKAFWMKDALKVHMRTHSNVKMFPCSHCPKAFAHKHTLDAHLRIHLDVQPYTCNVCQKWFIHKYNLTRHERQHVLSSSMPVIPSSVIPPGPTPMRVSVMMLPPMPVSPTPTTLHIL